MRTSVDPAALGFAPTESSFIADPYPVFERLRAAGRALEYPDRGVYLIPHFADAHDVLRDRRLGRAYRHRFTDADVGQPGPDPRWPRWAESERWSLLNLEPPDHTRLRRLITKVFTARAVAGLRPEIAGLAIRQFDELDRDFDLIADYAQPFSVSVICQLLGVPLSDSADLLGWSHAIVKMYEFAATDVERARAEQAADEFIGYVQILISRRRRRPAHDLITELVGVSDRDDRLTEAEIVGTVIVLLNAGHEATVNTLGNGMRGMMLHPAQWARVTSGEVPTSTAVEEMIRWDAPLQLFERWVLEDGVQLAGTTFNTGDRVAMLFGSANRDPDRFPGAEQFDVGRGDQSHIGFGGGLHFCIGAPLARLELEVSLDVLRRLPAVELTESPVYQPYFVIRGLTSLKMRR